MASDNNTRKCSAPPPGRAVVVTEHQRETRRRRRVITRERRIGPQHERDLGDKCIGLTAAARGRVGAARAQRQRAQRQRNATGRTQRQLLTEPAVAGRNPRRPVARGRADRASQVKHGFSRGGERPVDVDCRRAAARTGPGATRFGLGRSHRVEHRRRHRCGPGMRRSRDRSVVVRVRFILVQQRAHNLHRSCGGVERRRVPRAPRGQRVGAARL